MRKKSSDVIGAQIENGVIQANRIISDLAVRDQVDTAAYGFSVRRAGERSMALDRGCHPSEERVGPEHGSRDPRRSKAQTALSLSGALKMDFRREIEDRHDELVRLCRWEEKRHGRPPVASDYLWDPVMLALLRSENVELDVLVAAGPGEFISSSASRDYPSIEKVVAAPVSQGPIEYVGCIDGDAVRALRIRFAPGVLYSWNRSQPDHVELTVKNHHFPRTVLNGLMDCPFSTVVGHPSLAQVHIQSYVEIGGTITFKSQARPVRF